MKPFILVVLFLLIPACSKEEPKPYFELSPSAPVAHQHPLPTETEIFILKKLENKVLESRLGYRGWDFDGDNRFDMVEVLDASGQSHSMAFDFDGDGTVDLVKEAKN